MADTLFPDGGLEREREAERLMRWAKKATEVCSAWALNQLAHRCMLYMNGEATERGDWSGEHHRAYFAELQAEKR